MTLENPAGEIVKSPCPNPKQCAYQRGKSLQHFTKQHLALKNPSWLGKMIFPTPSHSVPQRTLRTRKPPPRPHWPVPSRCELLLWHVALLPNTAAFQTTEKERWAMNGFLQNTNVFGWWTCFHTHPREMEEINKTIPWQKTSQIWWFWGRFQPQKLSAETCVSGF